MKYGFVEAMIIISTLVTLLPGSKNIDLKHHETYDRFTSEIQVEKEDFKQIKVMLEERFAEHLPVYESDDERYAENLPAEKPAINNLDKIIQLNHRK